MDDLPSVLLFFVDGLGIGERDLSNPLFAVRDVSPLAYFKDGGNKPVHKGYLASTDATLGVAGRPQSASGQTTILTGKNAPGILGRHKHGFPNKALKDVIVKHSIFQRLKEHGIGPNVFANAYSPEFFNSEPRFRSATTIAVEFAGVGFRRFSDLLGEKAVYHEFSNRTLREKGYDVPVFSPEKAGTILAELTNGHRFVLYEHFITDKIGHDQDLEKAERHLPRLARFLTAAIRGSNPGRTTVILTSDHGNIENLSVRNHTLNPVPTVFWGRRKQEAAQMVRDLTDIVKVIEYLLDR